MGKDILSDKINTPYCSITGIGFIPSPCAENIVDFDQEAVYKWDTTGMKWIKRVGDDITGQVIKTVNHNVDLVNIELPKNVHMRDLNYMIELSEGQTVLLKQTLERFVMQQILAINGFGTGKLPWSNVQTMIDAEYDHLFDLLDSFGMKIP